MERGKTKGESDKQRGNGKRKMLYGKNGMETGTRYEIFKESFFTRGRGRCRRE